MSEKNERRWYIERDTRKVATSKGDDWMVRFAGPDQRRGYACWYGTRAEALKDLRRRFNGRAGKIL